MADDLVAQQLADLKSLPQTLGPFYTEERVVEALFARLGLEPRADEIVYVTGVFSGPHYRSWLFPGVAEVLAELHAAGLPLGRRGIRRFPYSHSSFFYSFHLCFTYNNKEKADRLRVLVRG